MPYRILETTEGPNELPTPGKAAEEEVQYEAYSRVLKAMGTLPVTIRTVDIDERERERKKYARCGDCGMCVHRDSCARSMGMLNDQKEWIELVLQEGWEAYDKVIKSGLKYEDYNWLYDALRLLSIIKDASGVEEALENFYH